MSQEDLLEKEMATHYSILAWETPWTEKPGGLQITESQEVRHDLVTKQQHIFSLVLRTLSGIQETNCINKYSTNICWIKQINNYYWNLWGVTQNDDKTIKWKHFLIVCCFKLTVYLTIINVRAKRKKKVQFSLISLFKACISFYSISYFFPRQYLKYWNVIRERRSWRQWIEAKAFWDKNYSSNKL